MKFAAIVLAFALSSCASSREPVVNVFPCDCPSDLSADYSRCGKQSAFCRMGATLASLDCVRPEAPDPKALCK